MSAYGTTVTQFKDKKSLCDALTEMGFVIEVHETKQNLYGYQNDKRKDSAEIIIRRKYVGTASNDIGFTLQPDGTYAAIISEYDSMKYNKEWLQKLNIAYGTKRYTTIAKSLGYRSATVKQNSLGEQQVIFQ